MLFVDNIVDQILIMMMTGCARIQCLFDFNRIFKSKKLLIKPR